MVSPDNHPGPKPLTRRPGRLGGPTTLALFIGLLVAAASMSALIWLASPEGAAKSGNLQGTRGVIRIMLALLVGGIASAGSLLGFRLGAALRVQRMASDASPERAGVPMDQLLQAEKMTALGELVAGVAHEINNPLASIMGYTQLLLSENVPAGIRRRLEVIFTEAERAGKIVRNLLAFARKRPAEKKYLGLNGVIEKTLELKEYHFRSSQIRVEKDLTPDLPMTMLDYSQMQQVLLNLLNNAEQALDEAGRGGTIRLITQKVGGRIEARISDDGPGIPPELQTRIFEPFFTTKKEGKGTGLGLPLCYGIVKEHGGTIRVESEAGVGTTFIIELPVFSEGNGVVQEAAAVSNGRPSGCLRVLIVDDEPNIQSILVEVLGAMGQRVDTASDVPEALRKIGSQGHDLIITDMRMPHGTGKDIYRAVVDQSPSLARRIIFTTGDGESPETQKFIQETGNEILPKPWNIQELEKAIANAMSR